MPPVRRFVVKNGSKIRSITAGSMPGPSSLTVATANSPSRCTSTRTVPPFGIAWRAFAIRFRKICLSWFGLALTSAIDVVVGVDELDALVRVRAPHEVDGGADDVFERDRLTFLGVLAREVEQRAHDLLDLEAGLLDQLEPLVRLRAGLGLLEQELGQAEDREQRVVDLVRDAGGELADRRELAALDELLVDAPLLRQVGDDAEQERRLAVVAGNRRAREPRPERGGRPSGGRRGG